MRLQEITTAKRKIQIAKEFIFWAIKKLKISGTPDIKFSNDIDSVKQKHTFGTTVPDGSIWVYVGERNTADVLRTLCHELVHFKQFEDGTASETMDEEQTQRIEDEANALAGRMMREYGKHNVEIYEGRTGSLQHEVADSLPQAFVIPELNSGNPYQQYKFGVAIAGARGRQQREYDNIGDFNKSDLDGVFADSQVVISFDPHIDKIIDGALKNIGVPAKKRRIGVKGSKESSDVIKGSPITPFKGY